MNTLNKIVVAFCSSCFFSPAHGQGTFQNLNFESANLPILPAGQYGSLQPIPIAIPSWSAYLGTNQISQALHNNMTIGSPGISVLGPNWNLGGILEGSHSVLLQAGRDPINFPGLNVSAAIAQSGQIPINSQSLLVRIQGNNFGINFAGQILATYEMSVAANYKVYGVDVSMFAGQTGELRFTSVSTSSQPFNNLYLDAISFSQQSVPEPNSAALIALGTLLFGVRSRLMRSWCA